MDTNIKKIISFTAILLGSSLFTLRCGEFNADGGFLGYLDLLNQTIDSGSGLIQVGAVSGSTTEAGGTATYTMVLTQKPTASVDISVSSSDSTEGIATPSIITFSPLDWNSNQTITITGVDDTTADGDQIYSILNLPASSTDTSYNNQDPGDILVTNLDNESSNPWSPPSAGGCSDLPYRRKITFGTSHDSLPSGYTASFIMDTTSATGHVQLASGNDVRIIWQPTSGSATELDRLGSNWDTTNTTVNFRLQSAIPANSDEDTDGSYFVYYGCATAGTPPKDEMNVYYFADFFDRANSSTVGNGWSQWDLSGGQVIDIYNQKLRVMPTVMTGSPVGAKQSFSLGDIPGNFTIEFDWDIWADGTTDGGENTWIFWGMNVGDSSLMTNGDRTTGVGVGLYSCEDSAGTICVSTSSDNIMRKSGGSGTFLVETPVTGLHTFKLEVDKSGMNYNYSRDGGASTNYLFTYGVTTIDQIRIAADNYGSGGYHYIDNLKIYLNPTNPPTTTAGAEETSF